MSCCGRKNELSILILELIDKAGRLSSRFSCIGKKSNTASSVTQRDLNVASPEPHTRVATLSAPRQTYLQVGPNTIFAVPTREFWASATLEPSLPVFSRLPVASNEKTLWMKFFRQRLEATSAWKSL